MSTGRFQTMVTPMNAADQEQWWAQHIPHRLRASLIGLPLQRELTKTIEDQRTRESIVFHWLSRSVSEGRFAAMRWLIEFVGVGERKKGKPGPPSRRGNDVSINMIDGGKEIDLDSHEAEILADVWKGCSQASGHPTQDTDHPDVSIPALDKALKIIVRHLEQTISSTDPDRLIAETLVPLVVNVPVSPNS
jgi:hypothetical protein